MNFLVIAPAPMFKPMQLIHNDGHRRVPDGGILLYCPPGGEATTFLTAPDAQAAINRTVEYAKGIGYGWAIEDYQVVSMEEYQVARAGRRRGRDHTPATGEGA